MYLALVSNYSCTGRREHIALPYFFKQFPFYFVWLDLFCFPIEDKRGPIERPFLQRYLAKDAKVVKGPWLRATNPFPVILPLLRFAPRKSQDRIGVPMEINLMFTSAVLRSPFAFPPLCSPHANGLGIQHMVKASCLSFLTSQH